MHSLYKYKSFNDFYVRGTLQNIQLLDMKSRVYKKPKGLQCKKNVTTCGIMVTEKKGILYMMKLSKSTEALLIYTSIDLEVVGSHGCSTKQKISSLTMVWITSLFWIGRIFLGVLFQKKDLLESLLTMIIGLGVCVCHIEVHVWP
jgi:hypothetical protein